MEKVALLILNYNGYDFLKPLIESIYEKTTIPADVYVIDNNSTDESRPYLDKQKKVKKIYFDKNEGYTMAYNKAYEQIKGKYEYLVLMNNDIKIITDKWLSKMIKIMDEQKDIGVLQPKLIMKDKSVECSGGKIQWTNYTNQRIDFKETTEQDWLTSALQIVRAEIIKDKKDLFLPLFAPISIDDVELSYYIKQRGFKIIYEPSIMAYHYGSATVTSKEKELFRNFLAFRNWSIFTLVYYPTFKIIANFLCPKHFLYFIGIRKTLKETSFSHAKLRMMHLSNLIAYVFSNAKTIRKERKIRKNDFKIYRNSTSSR